ncbi:hypothetical protein HK101_008888 [Irineochytrium annulatum]|nr:hypothetical protein HK101_008888 [Irineochytrium annulatum]
MHNARKRSCPACKRLGIGGGDLCEHHHKFKYLCYKCHDEGRGTATSICQHRQNKTQCRVCHPDRARRVKDARLRARRMASLSPPSPLAPLESGELRQQLEEYTYVPCVPKLSAPRLYYTRSSTPLQQAQEKGEAPFVEVSNNEEVESRNRACFSIESLIK